MENESKAELNKSEEITYMHNNIFQQIINKSIYVYKTYIFVKQLFILYIQAKATLHALYQFSSLVYVAMPTLREIHE